MTVAAATKAALRTAALARRDSLAEDVRAVHAQAIHDRTTSLLDGLRVERLAAFLPIRSEVDPRPIIAAMRDRGAEIALPAVMPDAAMVFRRYDENAPLVPAGFGTVAPPPDAPVVVPDVILVPLAAFDRTGARIGYGKGHYDRAIHRIRQAGHQPLLIGVAFSVQEVGTIPAEPHDVGLDCLITEVETIDLRQPRG